MKRMGFVLFVIVLFFGVFLTYCGAFSNKTAVIGEKMNLSEGNTLEIIKVKKEYAFGKYIRLNVLEGEQKKEVIFNTEEGRINNDIVAQLPDPRYQIVTEQDGNLKLLDHNNQMVLVRNLIKEDLLSTINDLSYEWSNTGKYLFINQVKNRNKLLIDVSTNKRIDIPLEGWFSIKWSNDDKLAVVLNDSSKSISDLNISRFIWNIEANTFQNMSYSHEEGSKWSPDNNYLFSIVMTKEEDKNKHNSYSYTVSRYSVKDNKWSDIYKTDKSINVDSFKVLNKDQFIYAGKAVNQTKDPTTALMKPTQDFIVKFDYSKNVEIERKLDSFLPKVFIWSFDNKYIYYQDYNGFFKAKVDF